MRPGSTTPAPGNHFRTPAAERRLDEFASIVSHDFRDPLGVATGGLELAKETNSSLSPAAAGTDLERIPPGQVANRARTTVSDDPGATVDVGSVEGGFYVADDGPGIPPEERRDVFDRGHTTAASGTGIGLALVRRIADAHGWRVELTDGEAGGARFEFST